MNDERVQAVQEFVRQWPLGTGHGDVIYNVCFDLDGPENGVDLRLSDLADLLAEREPVIIRTSEDLDRLHDTFVDLPWWHIAVESENGYPFIILESADGLLRYVKDDDDAGPAAKVLPFTVLSSAAVRAYRATTGEAGQ